MQTTECEYCLVVLKRLITLLQAKTFPVFVPEEEESVFNYIEYRFQ